MQIFVISKGMHSNYIPNTTQHYTTHQRQMIASKTLEQSVIKLCMVWWWLAMFKTHSYVRKCNLFSTRRLAFCFADVFIILLYEVMCVHLIAGGVLSGKRSKIYYFVFSCKLKAIHMSDGKKFFLVSVVD